MNTQDIIKNKITFDTKFTANERELCFQYVTRMLNRPVNHQVRHFLETDKLTTAHAYMDIQNGQYQLRMDTFEMKLTQPVKCIAFLFR